MSYNTYLLVLSQLTSRKKAECVVQGSVIFVESKQSGKDWNLSTKIFDADTAKIPSFLEQSLNSRGLLRWQERGAYLKLDPETNSVYLVQEILSSKKYVPFKYLMNDFAGVAKQWKDILDGVPSSDDSLLND